MADIAAAPAKKAIMAKKPATAPTHPTYATMISSAIKTLKERGGSSHQAILKHVVANYKIADPAKAQVYIKLAIRKMLADEKLIQVKGSFKLPKEEKAAKPKKVKEPTEKKPAAKKSVKKAKKPEAKDTKKTAAKKSAKKPVKKPATKKPAAKKSAKKPVPKSAKKPVPKKVSKK